MFVENRSAGRFLATAGPAPCRVEVEKASPAPKDDPNSCFDLLWPFLGPAADVEKKADTSLDEGNPENACLNPCFPFLRL